VEDTKCLLRRGTGHPRNAGMMQVASLFRLECMNDVIVTLIVAYNLFAGLSIRSREKASGRSYIT